ncbi:MAG: EamA-like transporter family protein [Bacteroidota bacterium]|nr:EamA-like transporter family protein [Bacteroidota bacterium]
MQNGNYVFFALALITGALIPVQAATNAAFSKSVGNPLITGLMVFVIGVAAMAVVVVLNGAKTPLNTFASAPWYGYLGGLIVPTYVVMITIITPRIGLSNAIGLILTGQIIAAVLIDQFGWFNATVRHIDTGRLIGVMLMICGIYFVMRKGSA